MVVMITIICWGFVVYGFGKHRYFLNPLSVMGLLWGIITPLSSFGLYGTNIPGEDTYLVILIGLIGYFIGALLGNNRFRVVFGKPGFRNVHCEYKTNFTVLYILCMISIIYFLFQFYTIFRIILSGNGYDYIRMLVVSQGEEGLRSNRIVKIIQTFIASPTAYLVIALVPFEFIKQKEKRRPIFIWMSLLIMALWVFTSGGRAIIAWLALYIVFILTFWKIRIEKQQWRAFIKKYRILILLMGIILTVFMLRMTYSRKGTDVDLLKQMYIYFVCPIPFLDYNLNHVTAYSHVMGYGVSSFYGVLYPIFFIVRNIFNIQIPYIDKVYELSFFALERGRHIGGEIYMNAFSTVFFQPYLDGRFVGVLVIMFLFGYVSAKMFYRAKYIGDYKATLLYMLLLQKIAFSMVRFYFTQQAQSLCFILAIILVNRKTSINTNAEEKNWLAN